MKHKETPASSKPEKVAFVGKKPHEYSSNEYYDELMRLRDERRQAERMLQESIADIPEVPPSHHETFENDDFDVEDPLRYGWQRPVYTPEARVKNQAIRLQNERINEERKFAQLGFEMAQDNFLEDVKRDRKEGLQRAFEEAEKRVDMPISAEDMRSALLRRTQEIDRMIQKYESPNPFEEQSIEGYRQQLNDLEGAVWAGRTPEERRATIIRRMRESEEVLDQYKKDKRTILSFGKHGGSPEFMKLLDSLINDEAVTVQIFRGSVSRPENDQAQFPKNVTLYSDIGSIKQWETHARDLKALQELKHMLEPDDRSMDMAA